MCLKKGHAITSFEENLPALHFFLRVNATQTYFAGRYFVLN